MLRVAVLDVFAGVQLAGAPEIIPKGHLKLDNLLTGHRAESLRNAATHASIAVSITA